jgi:anti-sigma factor RsiW
MNTLDLIDSLATLAHPREGLLHAYVLGDVSEELIDAVSNHLSKCANCRELAELFASMRPALVSADVIPISEAAHGHSMTRWRRHEGERLAAADATLRVAGDGDGKGGAPVVEHVPGATDGAAALGYLCGGTNDVVITGAAEGVAGVRLGGNKYLVGAADDWGIRVVEGLSRQDITMWLARGGVRDGTFAVLDE